MPIDDAEQGRRAGLEVAKRTMELFRAQGDEVNGLGAALRCHAAKECARRYPLHGPHSWCGKREAVSMRAFPPLGYASQAHITGTRPLDTVGRREAGVSSLY